MGKNKKVVVARLGALGDVAMALPVVYAACTANPDADFFMVTKKPWTRLAVGAPHNLKMLAADTRDRHHGLSGLSRLIGDILAGDKPDVFVDLHDVLRTRIIRTALRLRGINVTVFDKARSAKKKLVAKGAANAPEIEPTTVRYARALQRAGLNVPSHPQPLVPRWPIPNCPFSLAKKPGEVWVGVAPFAAHAAKIYPADLMVKALQETLDTTRARIFLFGGGSLETPMLQRMCAALPGSVCVAASGITMADELSLMSRLDVMVSMDSGNMHLAAAVGTNTISIWGGTHPAAGFQPIKVSDGQKHIFLQSNSFPCRPCSVFGDKPCRLASIPPCLTDLSPTVLSSAITKATMT